MAFIHVPPASPGTPRTGILLINLGTPETDDPSGVRRYLKEFLSDRRVIEASPLIWQPVLRGVVLNVRPRKSAQAYRRAWDRERNDSPLRCETRAQAQALSARFDPAHVRVAFGMRYGTPSLAEAVESLLREGCDRILAMPLYPQYSATTTATANDQLFRYLMTLRCQPSLRTLPSFPDDPAYIEALAESVRSTLSGTETPPQKVVVSFHGLPLDYVRKGDPYERECERTAEALRQALGMTSEDMPLTYQSRFGPATWLGPSTSATVAEFPGQGIKRIAVITPGFISDCVETLDEIGYELREEFHAAGGEELTLIPCLNASVPAIDLLEKLARRELAGWL
ncbi:ferrochelatase [Acetobacter sp. AN02]|uniref:ferrochelatase n=1 Tax=Acetobacter sp. AN02 TaxID=2894186 RepID=UPI0024345722|nr:ferrochelatase [Acetobacter sp. AN02]MDG6095454.1 ferrochelatase [Acetobacter sp. AN02]